MSQAIEMEPRNAEAHWELGRAYDTINNTEEAERTYRRAINLDPESRPGHWNPGVSCFKRASYGKAIKQSYLG